MYFITEDISVSVIMTIKPTDTALNSTNLNSEDKEQAAATDNPSVDRSDSGSAHSPEGVPEKASHVAQDAVAPNDDLPDELPQESGGQAGLDPTRYGDWEKKGRCTDF